MTLEDINAKLDMIMALLQPQTTSEPAGLAIYELRRRVAADVPVALARKAAVAERKRLKGRA